MKCPRCQQESPADADFCPECGAKLALVCASCDTANAPTHKFCKKCGQRLGADTGVGQAPGRRFTSPESYTPRHLAEKILTSKTALEGERKHVTVLFADLKGSMELLADRDPEEARKILDPVLELMIEAVHRYEGTVNQVMGDGIMALFGAPLAHEDHAVRACYTALRMQESVARYAEDIRRRHGLDVQIRVGLNSGEVVVRAIGSDLRMDYTAVGQTTHLAARMEQLARPGTIVIAPDTLALAEGYVEVKSLGPVPVKGLGEPIAVYEITGAGSVKSRFQATAARGLTRFVGRGSEVEQLWKALKHARAGRGHMLALVGEAGVGKSRLIHEFAHSSQTQGWLIVEGGAVSYGKAIPYLPVIQLLRTYFQIEGSDDARRIRQKVTGKLLTLDQALEPSFPALLTLLDVPVEDSGWEELDPQRRRHQTLDAIKRLLLRESQVQPLLVIFEDLHWIDGETQALLDSLIESLPTARLLLLVNYRPEYQHPWSSKTYYMQLHLDVLPLADTEELLRGLLGNDDGLRGLRRLLIERTEGNPFFVEESVRALIEMRVLVGDRGAYRLAGVLPGVQVPVTVQAVLATRIDRLAPADKHLLQSASVIGKDVPLALLLALAGEPEKTVRSSLTRLQVAEFLYETKLFPDLEYTFKHALTHEVAYGGLLQEQRKILHAKVAEAIERLAGDRVREHAEALAHHALRGEVWEKAVTYCRQAGPKAMGHSANREAVVWFEQALGALQHLPQNRETLEQAIDLRLDLRQALSPLGETARIIDYMRAAETIAENLGDQRRLGRIYSQMIGCYWWLREYDRAIEAGQRALAIAEALGDFVSQVVANYQLGLRYRERGDHRRAIEALKWVVASLRGDLLRERLGVGDYPAVGARGGLTWCLAELGDFAEGIIYGEEAVQISEALDHPYSLGVACFDLGGLYLLRGHPGEAISVLERGLALCQKWDLPGLFPTVASRLGAAYTLAGRIRDGLPLLERVEELARTTGRVGEGSLQTVWLGEAYRLAGRLEDASRLGERAVEISASEGKPGVRAWALRLLGDIAAHREPAVSEPADLRFRQALALSEELRMRPLVAHCHLGLGKLHRRTDRREQAREHLATATTMYREMGMTYWLEQAEVEMRSLA